MRARLALPLLAAAALVLTGCAATAFSSSQTADDELPAGLDVELDPASSRYAGSYEGVEVFVARWADDPATHCVVYGPAGDVEEWVSACSSGGWVESFGATPGITVRYDRGGIADREGWTRLGDYVLVR